MLCQHKGFKCRPEQSEGPTLTHLKSNPYLEQVIRRAQDNTKGALC